MDNENSKITLLVAGTTESDTNEIRKMIADSDQMTVVKSLTDGIECEKFLSVKDVDIVVMDVVLGGIDGFTLIENIKRKSPITKIIVVSNLTHPSFVSKAIELGASAYLNKPVDEKSFKQTVIQVFNQSSQNFANNMQRIIDKKLSNIFISVGIPAHIKGYQFLREAIKLAIDSPDMINSITKKLYPTIAEKFDTSSSKVERAIRHAIEVAWNRGKIENINEVFGLKIYSANDKPTNGEFIALVADKMLIEGA